ncbi:MAG: hypothetical protein HN795_05710 [Flavobacteriaceae bacterium]|nr:hypothetical protein [Flavobacteriaceae bacterium]
MNTETFGKPIDIVITWVDGEDEKHRKKMSEFAPKKEGARQVFTSRFVQLDEIKFTVRSIIKYAKFVRNIFIVTDNQTPNFLKENQTKGYEKVKIIDHKIIFKDDLTLLPVFNSRSIETKLHNIPGLAEQFIYFNDDVLLVKDVHETDFFIDGKPILRGKWKKFKENIFYKRFSRKKNKHKASHVLAQEKGAKLIGFKNLFKFHHTPHPMRVSTLKTFFRKNKTAEHDNSKHKFRSAKQFITQGVANHIELKKKSCIIKHDYQLIHFRTYKKPILWLKFKLNYFSSRKDKIFLNIQDLSLCPEHKKAFILNWLEERYQ